MPISIPIGKIEHWECYPFLDKVHTHTPSEEPPPPPHQPSTHPNHPVLTSDSHNWPHYRFNKTYPATYFRTVLGLTDFGMLVKSFNPGSFCLSLHHFARAGRAHKTLSPS